jgi:23S rRNA (pseudouridine1915-N3)-methyltransferase
VKLVIVAVGQRQPVWAEAAYAEFAKRFPPDLRLELKAIKAEPRAAGKHADAMLAAEAARFEAALAVIGKSVRRVVLDERGERLTTVALASRLVAWKNDGRDVALLIGGPDGLDTALKATADETMRLSDLTLPHAFARVMLAEALYRAWSVTTGHPYHRE